MDECDRIILHMFIEIALIAVFILLNGYFSLSEIFVEREKKQNKAPVKTGRQEGSEGALAHATVVRDVVYYSDRHYTRRNFCGCIRKRNYCRRSGASLGRGLIYIQLQ